MWASPPSFAGPILVPHAHPLHDGNNGGHRDVPDPGHDGYRCEQAHIGYWAGDPLRPRRHRHRLRQLDRRPPLRRPDGSRSSRRAASAAPASTSAASPPRCSSIRPTSRGTPGTRPALGVDTRRSVGAAGRTIRDRIFGRIDPIAAARRGVPRERLPDIDVYDGHAAGSPGTRTIDSGTGERDHRRPDRDRGGQPAAGPRHPRARTPCTFHTSDTVMRLDALPRAGGIVGGGYIAAEFAHMFSAFGAQVTQIHRRPASCSARRTRTSRAVHRSSPAGSGTCGSAPRSTRVQPAAATASV